MKLIKIVTICLLMFYSAIAHAEHYAQSFLDSYFTATCAGSCLGIYSPMDSAEFDYMRGYGWQITPYRIKDSGTEVNFALCKNYFEELDQNIYVLTVRGSASNGDWHIDFKTGGVAYEKEDEEFLAKDGNKKYRNDYPLVHRGFNIYTNVILKNIVFDEKGSFKGQFAEIMADPKAKIFLTGHSLGGAVATLLGERLVSAGMPTEKIQVITFGAPAIGNKVFAERYGNRINLRRVTNTADPIPGGLQTFFGNYKQFGTNVKFHLSPAIKAVQHDITMYFDYSIKESYKAYDEQIALGNIPPEATEHITEGVPVVALWTNAAKHIRDIAYITDTERMVRDEYIDMFPSFVIMSKKVEMDDIGSSEIIKESQKAGADYILVVGLDASLNKNMNYHYLVLGQTLMDKNGNVLSIETVSKKVSPSVGNIQAAEENFAKVRPTLLEKLPFLNAVRKPSLFSGR